MVFYLIQLSFIFTYEDLNNSKCFLSSYNLSSSSSYRAGSTDIPDPLSPLLPIVHRPR